jgi:hypothetical protein
MHVSLMIVLCFVYVSLYIDSCASGGSERHIHFLGWGLQLALITFLLPMGKSAQSRRQVLIFLLCTKQCDCMLAYSPAEVMRDKEGRTHCRLGRHHISLEAGLHVRVHVSCLVPGVITFDT